MSEKIYFNTSNKFSVKKSLVNLTTRLHHTLAPSHAKQTARKLLLTPARTKPKNAQPEGLVIGEVQSQEGPLKTYQLGQGPVWVLTHGWSGTASQFFPLMEHIASQGYTALAYDHPGHGESGGLYGHIPAFVHGLEAILDSVDEVAGLVGHSMGTASAIECHHQKLVDKPLLLIAPVLDYLDNLFGSVARSGYSMRLFSAVVSEVEEQYRYPIQSIDPYNKLKLRQSKTIIVHDEGDKFTKFSVSQKAAQDMENVTLVATQGQGHGRVMKCPQVMQSFDELIA
ncbi:MULTISPECIES: alpha/beta hydrolase [Vibrio]|uniref:alpha/beta hydrolase n=1 Tax=Vibrio TaxID=662 RepID=UPI0001B95627|nr:MULTISPECIES: alpha/beta hydrolase [Vibrio]EEX32812.1 predicted hydrolase or acyltransferase [Vibrio coralliilyticus ATCC BAA-450]MCM5507682.1 alpha/beta hydrolase [Vibrio sp. SCSIO 43169]MDE3899432.1 alpha/beta hydrolase [Vibrio sp. CC007]QFT38889.1 Alpha/beta hydrolase family protein [Vibrio sp. THAF64]QGM36574.1 Alpha/beta hydrolase family protein [Vibrio sp. THAF191d]